MSISNNYTTLINNLDSSIQKKEDENSELSQQEQKNKELLNKQDWEIFYLKMKLRRQKDKIYSFLKESGGLFNLNSDQRNFYNLLLSKRDSLSGSLFSLKNTNYDLNIETISLQNKQISNSLTIFNDTLDKGEYLNQQALFNKMTEGLG